MADATLSPLEAVNQIRNDEDGQVVLVLQGGGALGAYQGGVYHALHEAGIEPDWIIGTSIGAINASLIAGNKPEDRLTKVQEFWHRVETADYCGALPDWAGLGGTVSSWMTVASGVPSFFEPQARAFLGLQVPLGTDNAGYYSTTPLRDTLDDLVDFDILNDGSMRLTVGAAEVGTGAMTYFDSGERRLTPSHIMASGALPPAFPAIRIDGALYWDGGILSNTPAERIFSERPRRNALIFTVHLWNPDGPEPETIWDTLHRQKDIQYASRIETHIKRAKEAHRLRHVVSELAEYLPEEAREHPKVKELVSYGCHTRMHVVQLLTPRLENEAHTKDIDFTPTGIRTRWEAGYADTKRALAAQSWLDHADSLEGVIVHKPETP